MGGRYKDKVLRETRDAALEISMFRLNPQIGYPRTVKVEADFLAELIEEIQQHRETLGLVDGVPKDK